MPQSELQSLQERLRTLETKLADETQKTIEIQQHLESERKAFAADKKTLEETIVDISSSAANTQADEAERASVIKLQEERIAVSNSE
jgi:nucleoprotein TPR